MDARSQVDDTIRNSDQWSAEMTALRALFLDCGLDEAFKWNKPCYTFDGSNIVILQEMKAFLAAMFFDGFRVDDPDGLLVEQGPNSKSAKRIEFTSVEQIDAAADQVRALIRSAISLPPAPRQARATTPLVLAEELAERLAGDPELSAAFDGLTPGRQREYNLFISDAKQSATRAARVEKFVPKIRAGKGMRDR